MIVNSEWREMPFSEAVLLNLLIRLDRGVVYPFVDMATVSADSRTTGRSRETGRRQGR